MSKKKPNGYFLFMKNERHRIQEETGETLSIQEMAAICSTAWKNLNAGEKARYNAMAKGERGKGVQDREKLRLNSLGQNIAERQNAVKEAINRRIQEKHDLMISWDGRDILDVPFHLINFQVMYVENSAEYYLPMEVGLVSFTFRDGITSSFHCFIDPGDAPQGNLREAMQHSENTHQIPLHFEKADIDFLKIWTRIEKFVLSGSRGDEVPPLFCMLNERPTVESCLDFIHYYSRTGEPNIFTKIYTLEDLVMSLFIKSGKFERKPSESQIQDSLLRNHLDYVSSLRCSYHDDLDCLHCSLAIVRRRSFLMFDLLSNVLDFKLTENHMADEMASSVFTVMRPPISIRDNREDTRHLRPATNTRPFNTSPSPPSSGALRYPTSERSLEPPKSTQLQVALSDSDDDDSGNDDDKETSNVTKSKSEQYVLEELRKPKTHSMMMPPAGRGYGRGLVLADSQVTAPIVDQSQVRCASAVRPPPGFNPRPGILAASLTNPQCLIPATNNNPRAPTTLWQTGAATQSQGWGRGRGRGLPPQVRPVQQ